MSTVLVTGGSGFLGSHILAQLLAADHHVRTTVRNLKREVDVQSMLKHAGVDPGDHLSFFAADLESDAGWSRAVEGCDYVLHVASPFPSSAPKREDEVIVPAKQGTLRVLRVARDAGVKRVVLTSSFAAIGYGKKQQNTPFDETDWTDPDSIGTSAYIKSKAVAERAAWEFIHSEGGDLELSVINPTGIFGPVLGPDYASSIQLVQRMLEGAISACPRLYFGVVDVRDVAGLHILAMTHPAAKGERFLAVAGDFTSMFEMAKVLKRRLGAAAEKVPRRQLPNWLVRLSALRNPALRETLPELGKWKNGSNEKARSLLGWLPRSSDEAIVSTAESLIHFGLVGNSTR